MSECTHVYGVTHDGALLDTEFLSELCNLPKEYAPPNFNFKFISMTVYLDSSRGYATKFKYCPFCGEKLFFSIARAIAKETDKRAGVLYE